MLWQESSETRTKVSLCCDLPLSVCVYQRLTLDFQLSFNGIDKERQLAASLRIGFGGTLDLTLRQLNAYLRERGTGLF